MGFVFRLCFLNFYSQDATIVFRIKIVEIDGFEAIDLYKKKSFLTFKTIQTVSSIILRHLN